MSLIVLGSCCVFPGPTLARQEAPDPDDPTTNARMRIGPVFLTPTFRLQDIGIDDNVLNDEEMPEQDFTATLHSGLDVAIRLGRARLTGRTISDYVYFRKFSDQRSSNRLLSMQFALPLSRFRSSVAVDTDVTRERPNNEIDVRAQRKINGATAHLDIVLAARTELTLDVRRETLTFEEGETFRGISLKETLDRTTDRGMLGLKYAVTPLTDLSIGFEVQEDRFPADTSGQFTFRRDALSFAVKPLLEFSPDALIRGRVSVGYRRFTTSDVLVPDFAGVVSEVQVTYTLLGRTTVEMELARDVRYSFELFEPFYISTGGRVSVIHRFVGPIELLASVGRERLDYQSIVGFVGDQRLDTADTVGGGFAVRLGETARFEVKAEFSNRQSNSERGRGFDRMRILSAVNFGL